ncbi:MAG: hypothetical protein AAGC95_08925 [Pseudomonadota bacterium]
MGRLTSALLVSLFAAGAAAAGNVTVKEAKRGMAVTIDGTVDRITDSDEFKLRDETGVLEVYLGPNYVELRPGEKVTVSGFMDDGFVKELYARKIVFEDGRVVELSHSYD